MNRQIKLDSFGKVTSRGIGWTDVWGTGEGYTWNLFDGCKTGCEFVLPDGSEAICYAKKIAENPRLRSDHFFPTGHFEDLEFHENRLDEPVRHKSPSGIFFSSMSDWMAPGIPDEWPRKFLEVAAICPQHRFLTLTKHAPQLIKHNDEIPSNVWIGASIPASKMFGKILTPDQQTQHLSKTLEVLGQMKASVRFLSAEPLSHDISPLLWDLYFNHSQTQWLEWAIIGAASNGKITYQPEKEWLFRSLQAFDYMGTAVYFKENLIWTKAMAIEYLNRYAPFAPSQNFKHYGINRRYFPINALISETVDKQGKIHSSFPYGGDRNMVCLPIMSAFGKPIEPGRDYHSDYLESMTEAERSAYEDGLRGDSEWVKAWIEKE